MWMWDGSSGHDANVTAVAMNADTRRRLVGLVERYIPPGFNRDQGLIVLRGDPRDHIAAVGHALAARLKERLPKYNDQRKLREGKDEFIPWEQA